MLLITAEIWLLCVGLRETKQTVTKAARKNNNFIDICGVESTEFVHKMSPLSRGGPRSHRTDRERQADVLDLPQRRWEEGEAVGEAGLASSSLQFTLSALDAAPWRTKRDNSPIIARCFSLFGIVGESPSCFFSVPLVQTSDYVAVTNKTMNFCQSQYICP